jgi:hypothetical protein
MLAHVRDIFAEKKADRIRSADLVAALVAIDGGPWAEMGRNRKSLSQNSLARMLKPLGVAPDTIRFGTDLAKGYFLHRFRDAFDRYLPPEGGFEPLHRNNASGTDTSSGFETVTADEHVTVAKCEKSYGGSDCCGVTVEKGGAGEELHLPPLGRCAQCNGLAADAPLVTGAGDGYPPGGVHLHEQCRKFWLQKHRVGRERFRKVGAAPPGAHCCRCHSPEGEVALWKDSHVVGCPPSRYTRHARRCGGRTPMG